MTKRSAREIKNIQTWVRALRSGEYKQTQEALCTFTPGKGDAFCCLGVAADVVVGGVWERPTWVGSYDGGPDDFNWQFTSKDNRVKGESDVLPQHVLDDLFGPGLIRDQLTAMNDGETWFDMDKDGHPTGEGHPERKRSFRGIAQHIERVTGVKV